MRTTVDLPEDLHRIVTALARHTGATLSATVEALARRGLEAGAVPSRAPTLERSEVTGLPLIRGARVVTPDDVARQDDADAP